MPGSWIPLVVLVATLLPLWAVKRWISAHLQELSVRWTGDTDVALVLYFVVVLPGVVLHELSHWLMALVLGARVQKLSLGPVRKAKGSRVSLGSVRIGKVDPVRAGLIGAAPLLGGVAAVLLIGYLLLDVGALAGLAADLGLWSGLSAWLSQLARVEDLGLWVYLVFAISNAMLPSESDWATIRPVLILTGAVAAAYLIIAGVEAMPAGVVATASAVAGYLSTAFVLTLAVDAVFALLILPLTWATRRLQRIPAR